MLSDDTIAHIAKVLQVAILTGTDIVDNLRQLELTQDGNLLFASQETIDNFENNIQNLMDNATPEKTSEEHSGDSSFNVDTSIFNS